MSGPAASSAEGCGGKVVDRAMALARGGGEFRLRGLFFYAFLGHPGAIGLAGLSISRRTDDSPGERASGMSCFPSE